ncbi:S-layer homology domain-containing protein [Paenibacillus sp. LHD-117]|uniref:S-layer homology domain-containing protein n=1 Tax=Paenibacillus sp. LHD-117 TaxID=3071412 RepID=UPI0027E0F340|nr:S-layer homology domain-containing protein [Paenibacillus sp. LHD-117]MDQ6423061.1 S-layer homology domain-containing protein [Paenibacillus sp. LHD-117]
MKKKMIAMVVAFLLVVTNASMAHALSPVAEVYYNSGTSTYDSSDFESQLNDAIKAKLEAGGVNPKYVSIMDASADPAAVTDTHVHSGRASWYNGPTPEVETADYNHVQISNNGKTLTFYGYTSPGYKDFMLTKGSPSGKKIITFDMDESKVNYHSMEGGGFLFNTQIDSDKKLSGYAILYVQGAVKVYKINGVDAAALHNESSKGLSLMTSAGVTEIGSYTKGASTQHNIKINVTDTKLNMWDNGEQLIKDLPLPDVYGNEFGPIVSHVGHGCQIISIFSFDNMKLFSTSSKTLDEAVDEIQWETHSPVRYVVNINDDPSTSLDGGSNQSDLTNSFNNSGAQYVGVTSSVYAETSQNFIAGLANGGLHVDSGNASADIINAIADRIANKIITDYKAAILAIETAETETNIAFNPGDTKNAVKHDITLLQDDDVTTVWSSDQPSIIAPDGKVTRPVTTQSGTYVTLKATITKDGLTSEKTFTVYVNAADPAPLATLSAAAGNGQVTLSFPSLMVASDEDIVVEQSTDGVEFKAVKTVETLTAVSTSATVTGLTNGATYYFRLSVGSGYYEGESNVVTVKPSAPYVPVVEQPTMKTTVIVSDPAGGGKVVEEKITKLVGDNLKVSGTIKSANGQELNLPNIVMNEDGSFTLPKVAPGEYTLSMNVIAPNGEKLAGPVGKLIVDNNGNASLSVDLVDPYGTILDEITEQPVAGVNMKLYWADTELNRSKGRVPGTLVNLPELPDFAPNKNHNPQVSSDKGEYGWMVYADGDYYFLGEKDGYIVFDSRNDKREEKFGDDSYIKGGIIHVGETIVKFSFSAQPKVKETGDHSPFMVGYPDGTFQPDRGISRAEVAAILSRLYTSAAGANKAAFADVSANHWAADAITTATNNKWMVGNGNNMFQPKKQITRAEFAQMLTNLYKWDVAQESTYTDVVGHWAEKAIATVEKQGLLFDFTEKTFNPNQPITRVEVVRIFNQLLDRHPWNIEVEQKWTDVPVSHEHYTDIMEASIPHPFEQFETGIESWKE